jgi:hypothetical protein
LKALRLDRLERAASYAVFPAGVVLDFRRGASGTPFKGTGWHPADEKGIVSAGVSAKIRGLYPNRDRDVFLTADVYPAIEGLETMGQAVGVFCNGRRVAEYDIPERGEVTAVIPPGIIGADCLLEIEFRVTLLARPDDLGAGDDPRPLGIGLSHLVLE